VRDEEVFIKERMERIRDIVAIADPFIKARLLQLLQSYERRLQPSRPPPDLRGLENKMPPER
jgi:hypothetical protein